MADLDEVFKSTMNRARGAGALFGASPLVILSVSSLGKDISMTPPQPSGSGSDRARPDVSDELFFSGSTDGARHQSDDAARARGENQWIDGGQGLD